MHAEFLDETMLTASKAFGASACRREWHCPFLPLTDSTEFEIIDLTRGGMLDVLTRYCFGRPENRK